jgi:hypothetical protein
MNRLQAKTAVKDTGQAAAELEALLPASLQSSPGFRLRIAPPGQADPTGDRACKGQLT